MSPPVRLVLAALSLVVAAIALYGRAPQNVKIPEDDLVIWSNPAVSGSAWGEIVSGRYFDSRREGYRPSVRPVALLVHRLEYLLFHDSRAGYMWVQILLLAGSAVAFLWLLRAYGQSLVPAWLAALFLVAHPIGAAPVLGLSGTSELLCVLFALLGWRRLPSLLEVDTPPDRSLRSARAVGLWLMAGVLSSEIGYAFAVGALGLLLIRRRSVRPLSATLWIAAATIVPLIHRVIVMLTLPKHLQIGRAVETATGLDLAQRWLVGLSGVTEYVRVFFYPWRLTYTNDYLRFAPALPGRALIGLVLLAGLAVLAVRSLRNRRSSSEITPWAIWMFLALVGACGLLFAAGAIVPPRLFFAALPATVALLFLAVGRIGRRWGVRSRGILGVALAVAAVLPLGVRTWLRVQDHHDWDTLVIRQTETFPQSPQGWFDRGNLSLTRRGFVAALQYYDRATTIWPEFWAAWINMGTTYGEQDERGLAVRAQEKVLESTRGRPEFRVIEARANFNRAIMLMTQVRNVEAAQGFENMLEVFPDHLISHANLGMLYSNSEYLDDKATEHLNKALAMEKDAERRKVLGDFLDGIQRRRERKNRENPRPAAPSTSEPAESSDGWDRPDSSSQ